MSGNWQVHVAFEMWGILFCLIAAAGVFLSTEKKQVRKRRLVLLYLAQACLLFFDTLAWIYRGNVSGTGYYMVRISNAAVYVLSNTMLMLFTGYVRACIATEKKPVKEAWAAYLCALAGIALVIISQFNHMLYSFDASNRYVRGELFWLSQVVAIVGTIVDIWIILRYRSSFTRRKFIALLLYLLMPAAALVWQTFFYGISMLNVMMTLALMLLFLVLVYGQSKHLVEKEREINDMKIQIVLSQIQPHFLYNTLNTITYLCDTDAKTAKKALGDFSRFLRGNLDSLTNQSLIPFDTELRHIEHYLSLEKLRMGDELNVVYDISDNGFLLPPLTLQPLVENSVQHGLAKSDVGGTLVIRTRRTQTAHEIIISDDGTGFDVRSYLAQEGKTCVGIENVRKRLWSLCAATLEISSELGRGTKVVIRIPLN